MNRPLKVIVIGCGPAGLAAAHAATGQGAVVEVIAPKKMTPQRGPLLIQRPIPGINNDHPDGMIYQRVIGGSILDYRYKLYGDINIGINGDILQPHYAAWRHGTTYARLWELYSGLIVDRTVGIGEMQSIHQRADLVVSTANARDLCFQEDEHTFTSARVALTPMHRMPEQPDNTIVFNAGTQYQWVRSSRIFGNEVTEWIPDQAPARARLIEKPISTDCDCYPHILRTGRFGAWKNETWVDTAYFDTYATLESIKRAKELEGIE